MQTIHLDLVIVGGGIAGLWCLTRARQAGFKAILLEKKALGQGQTIASQGIIHGGTKYSLKGKLTSATQSIANMPDRWFRSLQGQGEINLSNTLISSEHHYLWSTDSLSSKMTTFFASKAMRNKAQKLTVDEYPQVFRNPKFAGSLYQLSEKVLDVSSLLENLRLLNKDVIFKRDLLQDAEIKKNESALGPTIDAIHLKPENLVLRPKRVMFSCGEAFTTFQDKLGLDHINMQLRPLHMVMVAHDKTELSLFAHAVGASSVPLMTVTSHLHRGRCIWYLGGAIAEEGVSQSPEELIRTAQQALAKLLPWVELKNPQWRTLKINRAEPKNQDGIRPDQSYLGQQGNCLVAWPTKLALSPQLSDRLLEQLSSLRAPLHNTAGENSFPVSELNALSRLDRPGIATPPWEAL